MKKKKMDKTNWKPVLKPTENALETAFVIENTIDIESILKSILVAYIAPQEDRKPFLNDIILNSSMLNLSAKIKAFHYLVETNKWRKIDEKHFHTILNVRNVFAHSDSMPNISVVINECGCKPVDICYYLESIKSTGKLNKVKRKDALHDFTQSYVAVKDYLHEILAAIDKKHS
jgi:hypothetical protein